MDDEKKRTKGFAFIHFFKLSDAIKVFNEKELKLDNRTLFIEYSNNTENNLLKIKIKNLPNNYNEKNIRELCFNGNFFFNNYYFYFEN
jgi:RNA recognition motif-containing protein